MRLGEISQIESGLILSRKRARSELELEKKYKILSLNNIEAHGDFNEADLELFPSNEILDDHYFTQVGEILLRLNEPFTSVCIQEHQAGVLIPSYFVSIEITHTGYLPEYVSWYLNTSNVRREFFRSQSGTLTPNINQKIIRRLQIPKLSLTDQENITQLHKLYLRERRLLNDLIEQKDQYYQVITSEIIKEKMRDY
ncbi:restriction endonuclease subunit S [Amphibacillus indicireducens]|uniref:Restriction endonuclease subunit S n=1 Tax=Amphibacillus indicireducens TaxID=1076330 RepID=A0ABP7V2L6_9BACI